jgi:hypothetical protein
MSEIEFESNNKEVLERCCKIIDKKPTAKNISNAFKRGTRLSIESILEQKKLRKDAELDC